MAPITSSHLISLFDKGLISELEITPYFRKADKTIYFDPDVLLDLSDTTTFPFQLQIGTYNAPTTATLSILKAKEVVIRLHDRGLITKEELRQFFGFGEKKVV